jgi:hypothetical protein
MAAGCTEWATLAVRGSRSILSVPCFALMLCDRRENVDREFVRKWHISSDKFDPGFHQPRNEIDVSREPVEFRDNKFGLMLLARSKGFSQLRPVVSLAAFDFDKLLQQFPASAV